MTLTEEQIGKDIKLLQSSFNYITKNVAIPTSRWSIFKISKRIRGGFQVIDPALVPEGLPRHTRSVAWICEAVLGQAANVLKKNDPDYEKNTQFDEVQSWAIGDDIIDYLITLAGGEKIYVNIKMHDITIPTNTQNDMNQGARIFSHFKGDPDFRFYYIFVNFEFTGKNNTTITFSKDQPTILYVPWAKNAKVNRRNGHLQAKYEPGSEVRTVDEFLDQLETDIVAKRWSKHLKIAKDRIKDHPHQLKNHMLWLEVE